MEVPSTLGQEKRQHEKVGSPDVQILVLPLADCTILATCSKRWETAVSPSLKWGECVGLCVGLPEDFR